MKNPITPVIDFLFPRRCAHCEQSLSSSSEFLCLMCWQALVPCTSEQLIHRKTPTIKMLSNPITAYYSVWEFCPQLQTILHHFKYSSMDSLSVLLGHSMAPFLPSVLNQNIIDFLVPVPLFWYRKRKRGYNQSELLCSVLSTITSIPMLPNALRRVRHTKTQTKLTVDERQQNVDNAFRVVHPDRIHDKSIIIVDDVITTGATINACGAILKANGAKQVIALSVARA